MPFDEGLARLESHYHRVLHKKVGRVLARNGVVAVIDLLQVPAMK